MECFKCHCVLDKYGLCQNCLEDEDYKRLFRECSEIEEKWGVNPADVEVDCDVWQLLCCPGR